MGVWQRYLLKAVKRRRLVRLSGASMSESTCILAAARSLNRQGLLVIVRLWNAQRSQLCHYAARPGATTRDGKPIESLNASRSDRAPAPKRRPGRARKEAAVGGPPKSQRREAN